MPKQIKKKVRPMRSIDFSVIQVKLQPFINISTENLTKYPLDVKDITQFLYESFGSSNITEIALNYTKDMSAFFHMLNDIHDNITDRNLKSRINRILKCFTNITEYSSEDSISVDES